MSISSIKLIKFGFDQNDGRINSHWTGDPILFEGTNDDVIAALRKTYCKASEVTPAESIIFEDDKRTMFTFEISDYVGEFSAVNLCSSTDDVIKRIDASYKKMYKYFNHDEAAQIYRPAGNTGLLCYVMTEVEKDENTRLTHRICQANVLYNAKLVSTNRIIEMLTTAYGLPEPSDKRLAFTFKLDGKEAKHELIVGFLHCSDTINDPSVCKTAGQVVEAIDKAYVDMNRCSGLDVQPYRADLSCKELTFAMAKADRMLEAAKRIGKDDYPVSDVDPALQRIFVQYEFTGKNGTEGKGSGHILPDDKDLMTRLLELHYGKSTGDNGILGFADSTLSVVYSPIESTIDTKSPYTILGEINMLYQTTSKIRISPEAKKAITETIPDTLANIDTTRAKNEDSIRKAVEKFDVAPTPVIRDTFGAKAEPNDDKWHKQVRVRYDFDGKKGGESYTTEEEKEVLTRLLKLDCGEPVMLHGSCESMSFKDDDMSLNVRYDTVYNEDDNGESAHQIILHIMEAYRALSDENAQDTRTKPVVGIDAMAVRIMTDITFNNIKRGCCTYIPTSQKAIFFQLLINKYGTLNCDDENAYSTKTNTAKISIRTYLVPAEEVTVCGAGAAIDEVREVYYEGFQEFMRMPINHKAYELNPVTVSFYAINKDNTYEKAVNVSVAIGDFDNLIASINRIVEAYHYSPVFLAKNVNCPNIFPGSEKYTEGNKTYSYQRDGHFDIVVVTNKATIPTTLISLADAVTAIASIVVGC